MIDLPVQELVQQMRQLGIQELRYHDVSLSLNAPPIQKETIEPSKWDDESKKDICKCEHQKYEHNDFGECLFGCTNCHEEEK